jgi:hypothetical protein
MKYLCALVIVAASGGCGDSLPLRPDAMAGDDLSPPAEIDPPDAGALLAPDAGADPDAATDPDASDPAVTRLLARLHLMQSDNVAEIQSGLNETTATALVDQVNAIWQPAQIALQIESIVRHRAVTAQEEVFVAGLSGDQQAAQAAFLCAPGDCFYDTSTLLEHGGKKGFNIIFVASMGGGKGGVYNGRTGAIVFAETHDVPVLAHEFAHALSLAHVDWASTPVRSQQPSSRPPPALPSRASRRPRSAAPVARP